jgi:glycosyltransferase involved in cell wall biosynthesis
MEQDNKYFYTPLAEPVPITEQEWAEGTLPLVHTRTMTYMHENYIRDCIEGILMQKTTFPVQVLIHDDASTDKTSEIVREYERKYPRLIKVFYQKENSYSKADKHERRAEFTSWRIGKYEAICEGDDYWTDPLKLQKQVDFLEANPEYGLVHTAYNTFYEKEKKLKKLKRRNIPVGDVFESLLVKGNHIGTLTVLYRKNLLQNFDTNVFHKKGFKMGDIPLWLELSRYSKFHYIDEVMAVYRINIYSASHFNDYAKSQEFLNSSLDVRKYFHTKYSIQIEYQEIEKQFYIWCFNLAFTYKNIEDIKKYAKYLPSDSI